MYDRYTFDGDCEEVVYPAVGGFTGEDDLLWVEEVSPCEIKEFICVGNDPLFCKGENFLVPKELVKKLKGIGIYK